MADRVLVTEALAEPAIQAMKEADVEVDVRFGLSPDQILEVIGEYEGLIVRSATKVTAHVIEAGTKLKVVGRAGIGVDNVDVETATRRGVVVLNAPQGNIISTAEHTVGLLLALARQIPRAHSALIAGRWEKSKLVGTELHDKTLGIIGLGRVGTLVTQRLHSFGMRIIACDPPLPPQRFVRLGVERVDYDELFARSDVISIHVTAAPENNNLIDESALRKMKPGVLILNTSRPVIDEVALARAIKEGHVGGAAIDVFGTEPLTSSPLFELPQVVVTPHIAGQTAEAQDKASMIVAEQVVLALRGEFVPNAVNVAAELPESLKDFIPLAEKLGTLACALSRSAATEVEVTYRGRVAEEDTRILTLAVLRKFLQPTVLEPVTYVNAKVIASDRGLEVSEQSAGQASDYLNLVRVTVRGDVPVSVAGTLLGPRNEPRLVEVDGVPIEVTLTPHMAFFRYEDKPGVVHRLTGPLSESDINIAGMQVGRDERGGEAILALSVDSEIPQDVFDQALRVAGIAHGKFVALGD